MLKRMIALAVSMVLILGLVPHTAAAENTSQTLQTPRKDMEAEIIKQIRAYADSIDQPNADDTAAWVLAPMV